MRPVRGGVPGSGALDRGPCSVASGELAGRQHPPQLRPAAAPPAAHRGRGATAGAPLPAGSAWRAAGAPDSGHLAPAGAGAVRADAESDGPGRGARGGG